MPIARCAGSARTCSPTATAAPGCAGSLAGGGAGAPARRRPPATRCCAARRAARTSTSAGRGAGSTATDAAPRRRCRCWSRDGVGRGRRAGGGGAHDDRCAGPDDAAGGARAGSRPPARVPGRGALRDVRASRSREQHQHVVDLVGRGADVHLPALLPAVHRRGRRAALPRRPRPLPRPSRTRARTRASGTSWRSRSGWPSSSQLRARPDGRVLSRARPAPPSRELPLGAWDRVVRRATPCWRTLAARRRGAARPHAGPHGTATRRAFLVPIDRCYELVGALRAGLARLRRRPGGPRAARRVLRRPGVAQPAGRARRRAMSRAVVQRRRRRPRAVRGRARTCWPGCGSTETTGAARARAGAARPGPHRAAAPPATTTPRQRALLDLFGDRTRFAETLKPFPWLHASTVAQGFTRRDRGRPAAALHLRLRGRRARTYLHALRDGEIPLLFLSAARSSPAARPASPSQQVPWDCEARYRLPVAVWRDLMAAYFPGTEWLRHAPGHRRGARRTTGTSAASPAGTTPSPRCSPRRARRPGSCRDARPGPARRRRRPLRGLPALPLPVERRQEPGAAGSSASSARPARRPPGWGRRPTSPSSACCGRRTTAVR